MTYRKRLIAHTAMSGSLLVLSARSSRAQEEADSAKAVHHERAEASLAKASQNPVANMVSLPLQYNFYTGGGLDTYSAMVLNVQPDKQ